MSGGKWGVAVEPRGLQRARGLLKAGWPGSRRSNVQPCICSGALGWVAALGCCPSCSPFYAWACCAGPPVYLLTSHCRLRLMTPASGGRAVPVAVQLFEVLPGIQVSRPRPPTKGRGHRAAPADPPPTPKMPGLEA